VSGLDFPQARAYDGAGPVTSGGTIAGRLRAVSRRLQNDAGWFSWRGVSDLAALGYMLNGREADVMARLDAYARARRSVVRVLGMLGAPPWVSAGLAFSPRTPGYADARARLVAAAGRLGLYVKFDLFADAQIVVPSASDRRAWMEEFAQFCRSHPGVIPGLTNEPFKNGWQEADDPALLDLAESFARLVGHRDFFVGDPGDGGNPDASAQTTSRFVTLSRRSTLLALHPDRSFGTDTRWRRWIDHLEGMTDVLGQLAPGVAYVVDEPIGAAPAAQPGRRDNDPDAFVAAQVVAACCGFGFTYHKIDGEIAVDQLPGFYGDAADLVASLPASPEWRYLNDSWPGAPTAGIRWAGKEGKVRNLVRGDQAWTVAYGEADFDSVKWRAGWTPRVAYTGARVRVWAVNQ
jgi:hypothetical protein